MSDETSLGALSISLRGHDETFTKTIKKAEDEATKAASRLEKIASKLEAAGNKLTTHITAPLLALKGATLAAFAQFDDAMTRAVANFGPSAAGMRSALDATAKQISGSSLSSATDLAHAYDALAESGMDAQHAQAGLATIEQFSVATGMDAQRAAAMLAQTQRQLGMATDDVAQNTANLTKIEDELNVASNLAGISTEEMAESLQHHGGAALRRFNVPLERGLALLAMFAEQGVRGGRAGKLLAQYLEEHTGEVPGAGGLENAIAGAGGATAQRAAMVMKSFSSQATLLKNNLNLLAVEVGSSLVPHLERAIAWVQKGTAWFKSLSDSQRQTAVTLGTVAAGLGPALKGLALFTGGFAGPFAAMAAGAVLVGDALGVTNTGLLELVNNTDLWGKTVSERLQESALDIGAWFEKAKASMTGDEDAFDAATKKREQARAYMDEKFAAEKKKREEDAAKQRAKFEGEAAALQAKINGLAAANPTIPLLDLEIDKLKEKKNLQAESFAEMSLRRFSLAGFAYAQLHAPKAAPGATPGTAATPGAAAGMDPFELSGVKRGSGAMNRITANDIGVTKGGHRQTLQNRKGDPWALDEDRRLALLKAKERYDNVGDVPIDTRGEQMLKYLVPRGGIAAGVPRPKSFTDMPTEFAREASYTEMSRTKENAMSAVKAMEVKSPELLGVLNTLVNVAREQLQATSQGPRLAR